MNCRKRTAAKCVAPSCAVELTHLSPKCGFIVVVRRHLTPSLVISMVALFVALGGASYAAVKIPKNSVGAAQIKKNAVTSARTAPRATVGVSVVRALWPIETVPLRLAA